MEVSPTRSRRKQISAWFKQIALKMSPRKQGTLPLLKLHRPKIPLNPQIKIKTKSLRKTNLIPLLKSLKRMRLNLLIIRLRPLTGKPRKPIQQLLPTLRMQKINQIQQQRHRQTPQSLRRLSQRTRRMQRNEVHLMND